MKRPNEIMVAELENLRLASGGTLNPEDVVFAAAKKHNPLHPCFEWDEGVAAHQYRLEQARKLIRVCVTVLPQKPEQPIRVYVSLRDDRGTEGYRAIVDVLGDAELRDKLLTEAKAEMQRFQVKYGILSELAGVFEAMTAVA